MNSDVLSYRCVCMRSALHRTATQQISAPNTNCENKCVLCRATEYCVRPGLVYVRTCTYVHVRTYVHVHAVTCGRSSFIDFRDGRFTEGLINWLRVAAKDFRKRNLFFTCVRTAANTFCKHLVSPFRTQRSFINFHSQIILDSILLNVIWNSRTPLVILIWCNPTP